MSFNARIKSKRDTASNWETNNPVLLNGELIIVDTNAGDVRFKIGDGVKTYTQLPFQDESLYNVLSTKADSADLESIQASIVQSDLSQTDNTAIDYVKGVIRKESLPEGYPYRETVGTILDGTFEFADEEGIYRHQITDENFAIVDNESYAVIWDGKTYRCVAAIFLGSAIILGNLAIANAGDDTGEPFLFVQQGATKLISTSDTATTHTVTVCAEAIHQIADDFIPDIGRGMILKNFNGVMPAPMNWSSTTYGNGKFVTVAVLYNQAAYCDDDLNWKSATLPSSVWWFSITYGNGKFVIVSYDNSTRAAYSEDGVTWTASTLPSSADWRSVTYGNGKFVAVADNSNAAAYSADGITWTAATLPSSQRWCSVTYGNDKFVAVAQDSTTAAYSTDGITWTASTLPSSETWLSVTYGNGKFVVVANYSTTAAYSTDGITWTAATMPSRANWYSITYGNGKFVTIADNSTTAAYSEDGITWIQTTLPSSERWQSVAYGNGKFVAVVNASNTVAYSRDGINWYTELKLIIQNGKDITADTLIALKHTPDLSQTDSTQIDYVKGVLRNEHLPEGYPYKEMEPILDGTFEFANTDGLYTHQITDENFTITPGKSYTVIWDGETYQCVATNYSRLPILGNLAIAHAGSDTGEPFLFAIQDTNKLAYTTDTAATHTVTVGIETIYHIAEEFLPEIAIENGMTLKNLQAAMPISGNWSSVTYGNGKFVAVVNNSTSAAYSEDCITWTETTMPISGKWSSVTYGNGKFVAVASDSTAAAYSADGIAWAATTMPSSTFWNSITYGNGKFVAVAWNSDKAAYSEDGMTWTSATLPTSNWWSSVTYGNGKFVAMISNYTTKAAYSEDGVTWTAAAMPVSGNWESVTYGNGKFVAVASGSSSNRAAYSADGITWTETTLPSSASWESVIYGNGKFVAVASNSTAAAYSEDGITWTASTMPSSAKWISVTYGNGKFVAVADASTTAAYSEDGITWHDSIQRIIQNGKDITADTLIALEHTHEASKISAGTFAGKVVANANAVQTLTAKQVRNIYAGTADMTAGTTELATGDIYIVYE